VTAKKKSGKALATLPIAERAVVALGMREREQELIELAASTATIAAITNPDGYKQVRAARIALKNERLAIQKTGKDARDDATKFSKAVIAEENRLIALIEPEEKRLGVLQDEEDTRLETERQAEIDREVERQAKLQERVAELRGNQMLLPTSGANLIAEHIGDLEAIAVDESFEEFREQAEVAKTQGLTRLRALHTAAIAHQAEQKKIAEDRAELTRLKAEAAERERKDKIAQVKRVEIERQAAELLKASEPAPPPAPAPEFPAEGVWLLAPTVPAADTAEQDPESVADSIEIAPPTRDELIAALTSYYGVDDNTILAWLSSHDWREALTELAA
jgi:hypothetical protein